MSVKQPLSVNLSSCLAYENKKTLLIDCDPQGNSTSGLGIEKDDYELSIYDCFVDSSKTKDSVIKTKYNNLYVIPSSTQTFLPLKLSLHMKISVSFS